jgi:hypothetical protein
LWFPFLGFRPGNAGATGKSSQKPGAEARGKAKGEVELEVEGEVELELERRGKERGNSKFPRERFPYAY